MDWVHNMFDLTGKTAIVTGGATGLGRAMAEGLHKAGAQLVLIARNEQRLEQAAKEMGREGAPVSWVSGDLSRLENVPAIYQKALDQLGGKLDILVNNAGIQHRCKAVDFPLEKWNAIVDTNLSAVFALAQQAGRTMLAQGHGRIINIASMTSYFGSELIPAYAASKGGVMQLTKALANEWTQGGVNVNAIAPGYMVTELTGDMEQKNPAQYREVTRRIPAHRWGRPEDLQGVVVFLASEASAYLSGTIIPVDGGYLGK